MLICVITSICVLTAQIAPTYGVVFLAPLLVPVLEMFVSAVTVGVGGYLIYKVGNPSIAKSWNDYKEEQIRTRMPVNVYQTITNGAQADGSFKYTPAQSQYIMSNIGAVLGKTYYATDQNIEVVTPKSSYPNTLINTFNTYSERNHYKCSNVWPTLKSPSGGTFNVKMAKTYETSGSNVYQRINYKIQEITKTGTYGTVNEFTDVMLYSTDRNLWNPIGDSGLFTFLSNACPFMTYEAKKMISNGWPLEDSYVQAGTKPLVKIKAPSKDIVLSKAQVAGTESISLPMNGDGRIYDDSLVLKVPSFADKTFPWDDASVSVDAKVGDTVLTQDNASTATDVMTQPAIVDNTNTGTGTANSPDLTVNPDGKALDFSPLYFDLSKKFPFSIPWDIFKTLVILKADPIIFREKWTMDLGKLGSPSLEIDGSIFDGFLGLMRKVDVVIFAYFLMRNTKKFTWGD